MQKSSLQIFQDFCWWKLQIWIKRLGSRDRLRLFGAWSALRQREPVRFSCPHCRSFLHTLLELQWEEASFLGSIGDPSPLQTGNVLEARCLCSPCASKACLGLACCTVILLIFGQSFIGVMLKETLQQQGSLRWMDVFILQTSRRPNYIT